MRRTVFQNSRQARGGLMLMECLVYLSVWFVIVSVGFGLFYQAYSKSKQLSRNARDIVQTLQTGERWRAEVRATALPPRWVTRAEGEEDLDFVLGGEDSWIAYRATGSNILRRTAVDPRWQEVLRGVASSAMVREERAGVVSWRWELEIKPYVLKSQVRPRFSFQAVPRSTVTEGGDER